MSNIFSGSLDGVPARRSETGSRSDLPAARRECRIGLEGTVGGVTVGMMGITVGGKGAVGEGDYGST